MRTVKVSSTPSLNWILNATVSVVILCASESEIACGIDFEERVEDAIAGVAMFGTPTGSPGEPEEFKMLLLTLV